MISPNWWEILEQGQPFLDEEMDTRLSHIKIFFKKTIPNFLCFVQDTVRGKVLLGHLLGHLLPSTSWALCPILKMVGNRDDSLMIIDKKIIPWHGTLAIPA